MAIRRGSHPEPHRENDSLASSPSEKKEAQEREIRELQIKILRRNTSTPSSEECDQVLPYTCSACGKSWALDMNTKGSKCPWCGACVEWG